MSKTTAEPVPEPSKEETPAPAPAPAPVKKEVSQEVLDRLAKGREALNAKRAALAEQRKIAQEYLESQKESQKAEKAKPAKTVKAKAAPPPKEDSSESDSSTDSSDTSDSEAEQVSKRGKVSKRRVETKKDYKAELERMKAKYQERYKNRYEILVRSKEPPANTRKPVVPQLTNQETIRQGATAIAKSDVKKALEREVLSTTMKNIFG